MQASRPEFAAIRAGYAGDMATGFLEYQSIRNDLLSVGASGIGLVLAAVLLYFMRLRALVVMGVTIGVALVWTFGITQLCIGYLNVATGFLASIVAGNGINVGILYQSRYFEERRRGVPIPEALRTAVRVHLAAHGHRRARLRRVVRRPAGDRLQRLPAVRLHRGHAG